MGTSNWQQIPFCVDALMKIAPMKVLDIGVGFGRWGMVVREFCDVWYQRVFRDQWQVRVEGIEAFPRNIENYHKEFYDKIYVDDAVNVIDTLSTDYDVVIFGDVLEHFDRPIAERLLATCLEKSAYVIVNIPLGEDWPQADRYENEYERHRSTWEATDFEKFGLVRKCLLRDYIARSHGSFILSRKDPKDLRSGLFSPHANYESFGSTESGQDAVSRALDRVAEHAFELDFIKKSRSYKLAQKIRKAPLVRLVNKVAGRDRGGVLVRVSGQQNPASQGSEVWLLETHLNSGEPALPWDFVERNGPWVERPEPKTPYGKCIVGSGGEVRVPDGPNPELVFLTHPWSGKVEIECNGRSETVDLYSKEGGNIRVLPMRSPMVVRPPAAPADNGVTTARAAVAAPAATPPDAHQQDFIRLARERRATCVAVFCPRWLGVSASTRTLFDLTYPVPASPADAPYDIPSEQLEQHARVLLDAGIKHVVFSGGDESHYRLARALKRFDPNVRCDMLWHGNYVQWTDDYVWRIFQLWVDAAREGVISRIGTVKKGMEQLFAQMGVPGAFVMNHIPGSPRPAPQLPRDPRQIGMWMSGTLWKSPNPMLAAMRLIPNARLNTAGIDDRAKELVGYLKIPTEFISTQTLAVEELIRRIRSTHLTMYVTFTECCPMVPLESMHAGVPCILGPTSHLFEDNQFLFERLVVPFPDRADIIAKYTIRAMEEGEAIMSEYARYTPEYNRRAKASVDAFLS